MMKIAPKGVIARHGVPKQSQKERDCFALLVMTKQVFSEQRIKVAEK
jgi:hypothetical protein